MRNKLLNVSAAACLACASVLAQPAGTEIVLHNFGGLPPHGSGPYAGLTMGDEGNFYGTTVHGGPAGRGVVFKLSPAGLQTVLYSFTGGKDGAEPYAGVTLDSAGNLYGTTYAGGTAGPGVIYKLDASGQLTVLHSFLDDLNGDRPQTGVVLDAAGNIYGATAYDAVKYSGVVYKLDTSGNYSVLHAFTMEPMEEAPGA